MGRPPEAFMIFREELRKAQLEKDRLKEEYEKKVEQISKEVGILKEQLSAQENMMKSAFEYVNKLEEELYGSSIEIITFDERLGTKYAQEYSIILKGRIDNNYIFKLNKS